MAAAVIIPARYESTRFPGKPLVPLMGKPLIQHVYENSTGSRLASTVLVATDSDEIYRCVLGFGGRAVMTSSAHASGTDRCAEAARTVDCDIIVNVQGDEPLVRPEMIDSVIGLLEGDETAHIGTLLRSSDDPGEFNDPNVVKAVVDGQGFAVYFSRAPVPYRMDGGSSGGSRLFLKHVGIYGYRRETLFALSGMEPTGLEKMEGLEQLRALENGMRIKTAETEFETIGVDTPEDLERVLRTLRGSGGP